MITERELISQGYSQEYAKRHLALRPPAQASMLQPKPSNDELRNWAQGRSIVVKPRGDVCS